MEVIGMHDELKGQVPVVFATLKQQAAPDAANTIAAQLRQCVVERLGAVARPAQVYPVQALPKTRSGKLLRRSLQALAEQREPGDLSTLDDPGALDVIRRVLAR
ncbi:AMP-binding enzyme [Xanthomonas translucens]|uniref:AMP-binding enzyme n=1 Tax=Xanthomonas campestris pv. translucens TaxID=343 RepID=UPI001E62653E